MASRRGNLLRCRIGDFAAHFAIKCSSLLEEMKRTAKGMLTPILAPRSPLLCHLLQWNCEGSYRPHVCTFVRWRATSRQWIRSMTSFAVQDCQEVL